MIDAATTKAPEPGEFARELRKRRLRLGLKIAPAARRAGMAPGTWAAVENGYFKKAGVFIPNGATQQFVMKAARAIGWDMGEALKLAGYDFDPDDLPPEDELDVPTDSAAVLKLMGGLLPTQRRVLVGLIKTMQDPYANVEDLLKAS